MRHNQNNDITHIEVEPLTDSLKSCYGVSYFLEEHKALDLQRTGIVRIIDKEYLDQSDSFTDLQTGQNQIVSKTAFMKTKKKLKIAWIQDQSNLGGAELSNLCVIKAGIDCGFDIVQVTPKKFNKNILLSSDIIVLNNIFEFADDQFKTIMDVLFFHAKPFVKYDHDLRELRRLNITRKIFERSLFNVFISPAHQNAYIETFGSGLVARSMVLPLALDTNIFYIDSTTSRIAGAVVIPTFSKGHAAHCSYIQQHPDQKFTILHTPHKFEESNISKIGSASLEKMADLYRKHEYMVHLPNNKGAGERVYFEALLCGCKPIVNENVSHQSWEKEQSSIEDIREWLTQAPYTFWKTIDEQAKNHCLL